MAGVGKSTIGVLLAKALYRNFVDTDLVVQSAESCKLQDIVDKVGKEAFQAIEEQHILTIQIPGAVIATGGSVVYSEKAMKHLKQNAITIFLELPPDQLEARITNADSRGLAMNSNQTFNDLYQERLPLYQKYGHITVNTNTLSHDGVVDKIISVLQ
jgi:shikimate kinase